MFHLRDFFKNETEEVIYFQNAVLGFFIFLKKMKPKNQKSRNRFKAHPKIQLCMPSLMFLTKCSAAK